ncbi:hypothetical protein ABFZ85_10050 [Hyphococcus formosus]|uniref:hypothetical protein n=1 Tax=Hyphococcus formosus TaxID=3143534 RepID=UPI00398A88C0
MQTSPVIQPDIAKAFSVKSDQVFHRANNQVYAIVGCNRELGIVSDVWFDRYDRPDEFRHVLRHVLQLFQTGSFQYWLADLRFMLSDFSHSEDWLMNEIMPAAFSAGLEREAVVLPNASVKVEGIDTYASASRTVKALANGRVRAFSDVGLAKRWLLEGEIPEQD